MRARSRSVVARWPIGRLTRAVRPAAASGRDLGGTHAPSAAARASTLLLAAAALLGAALPAAAAPDRDPAPGDHAALLTTSERDCYELNVSRPASVTAVDAVVPDAYTVRTTTVSNPAPGQPPVNAQLRIIDYSCLIAVDAQQHERRSQVSLGLAEVLRGTTPAQYLLWIATDNPVLAARYRQVGLPAAYVPKSSTSEVPLEPTAGQARSHIEFEIVGGGVDHTVSAVVVEAPPVLGPQAPFTVYYQGRHGEVRLAHSSAFRSPTGGRVTADYRAVEGFLALLNQPIAAQLQDRVLSSVFFRGEQTGTVERLG